MPSSTERAEIKRLHAAEADRADFLAQWVGLLRLANHALLDTSDIPAELEDYARWERSWLTTWSKPRLASYRLSAREETDLLNHLP